MIIFASYHKFNNMIFSKFTPIQSNQKRSEENNDIFSKSDSGFTEFESIASRPKESIVAYYKENNIPFDDLNPYLMQYLGIETQSPKNVSPQIPIPKKEKSAQSPLKENMWGTPIKYDHTKIPRKVEKELNPIQKEIYSLDIPEEDKKYLDTLAMLESSYRPHITNSLGYFGLYQFGKQAMEELGIDLEQLQDTIRQHESALELASKHEKQLETYLKRYSKNEKSIEDFIGKTINGITITRNGLRAAAHQQGALTVYDWLMGTQFSPLAKKGFKDGYGTHITKYFEHF
jgi:hypothetical protein